MGTTIATIKGTGKDKRDLNIKQFAGPNNQKMLQITQGFGGCRGVPRIKGDEPGFIQLTAKDAERLVGIICNWLIGD